ncbi:uncharacterized protein CCOS01_15635 [Colletotrichum costaricense]|uniref:Uncharacterized protein n=1 Tax=Colletotrichum costaricense TaxID=1209916 RepID=A0AAI9YH06_9PEZI|nr:uncharacterized protein CCOS01_15635 [Colletotrichum costaricense]KAK1509119.1 hypothetical protein CCOS01_15635 [Colletotrichum costaricense]
MWNQKIAMVWRRFILLPSRTTWTSLRYFSNRIRTPTRWHTKTDTIDVSGQSWSKKSYPSRHQDSSQVGC